ncbi:hypothetical protein C1J03_23535 (plasmid) [Sulfitobacter sp. SK012]|uniref:phage holin family protein n=1 Tax=Sulfitobacter sp. SK012 TaxID=1389005 RepID=UPI000E0A2B58|nr:phage holin family protein [Sulfitobacter sp. SK012]AXI49096.1 hypothetical protein C1J03_23535 [Sulfitobacter sp. SK012]
MNRISRNLITIYRTERLITRRRIAVVQQQTALMALAGLATLAGLILLNAALYFVLTTRVSPAVAAGVLALVNLALAGLLASVARRMSVEDAIAPAVEVRDMAITDLEAELEGMTLEARQTVNAIKGLGSNPLGSIATLLVPLLTAALKKKD